MWLLHKMTEINFTDDRNQFHRINVSILNFGKYFDKELGLEREIREIELQNVLEIV